MKRFHVHAHVEDLQASIAFYSKMFAAEPTRVESDYAKWMLEDPRINFAISTRGGKPGIDHLGFQTDTTEELVELKARAAAADLALLDEGETTCCYARRRSTGSPTRRASPGSISTRSTTSPCSARGALSPPSPPPHAARRRRRVANPSASRSTRPRPAAEDP